MDFIYLFRVLMKKKWIIIGAALTASLIAFFFTRNQQKKYKSISQISTGFTQTEDIRMNPLQDNFGYNEEDVKFNNVTVTAESPTVISLLSYALILHDLQSPYPFRQPSDKDRQSQLYQSLDKVDAIRVFSEKLESMSPLNSYKREDRELLKLLEMYGYDYKDITKELAVYRLQRTDYIQIEFLSGNPDLSAFVVNTLYQQFLRYYRTVRSNRSIESIDTLQSILDRKKQELDAKNELLRNEGILNVGQENGAKFQMILDQNQLLTEIQTKQTEDNYALQQVTAQLAGMGVTTTPVKTAAANAVSNDELLQLRAAKDSIYQLYINSGSADANLRRKYENLKNEYDQKVGSSQSNATTIDPTVGNGIDEKTKLLEKKNELEVNLRAENTNIGQIQERIAALNINLTKDASKAAALQSLIKDADLANKEYLDAKQRFNDANDIMASSVNNFRQILVGQPPLEPESSKRVLIVGLAGAFTLVIAILIITLMTYFDSSLKTPVIFAKTVNLRLLSMVNFTNLRNKTLSELIIEPAEYARPHRRPSRTVVESNATADNNRQNVFRESIRKLRYEIETSGKRIFLFASTKKGEGKTTLIQMLAFSLSLNKKKVLIIDTNFSNNDLTVQLNADPILERIHPDRTNPRNLLEQVRSAAKNVIGESVYVIGAQGGDYTPSEILPRDNLLQQLHALKADFDYIFLEGPPLNDFSDSKELAQYVEGVIAVFSSHHVIKQIDKQSITFFSELNGKFCGAILNMVDLEDVNVI
ncbi:MAG TPA: AAA family ATPase [Puia sp.]|nr:AAA family ATPase [Puia sp.]